MTNEAPIASFPAFTVAALVLLILKLTAYPSITWGVILLVWTFPILFILAILGITCLFVGLMAFIAFIIDR